MRLGLGKHTPAERARFAQLQRDHRAYRNFKEHGKLPEPPPAAQPPLSPAAAAAPAGSAPHGPAHACCCSTAGAASSHFRAFPRRTRPTRAPKSPRARLRWRSCRAEANAYPARVQRGVTNAAHKARLRRYHRQRNALPEADAAAADAGAETPAKATRHGGGDTALQAAAARVFALEATRTTKRSARRDSRCSGLATDSRASICKEMRRVRRSERG